MLRHAALKIALLCSCYLGLVSCANVDRYDITITNEYKKSITNTKITYGELQPFGAPNLSSGDQARWERIRYPIVDTATITFLDDKGNSHSLEVPVASVVPESYDDGEIAFIINKNMTINTYFIPKKEEVQSDVTPNPARQANQQRRDRSRNSRY